ncbi:hypothetical protein AVEN_70244-1 [Araneus ventricosus]|uniref:Uncharacterized protein n=1 Tax=Araneus ventricosus TaxID=182803 RepID=A0A4Y2GDD0_ARAVE|nr:hypothetical protein AVEN_70244-1 [Araneus ventricosus]
MDVVDENFARSIVAQVMSHYFSNEISDPWSSFLPKKLITRISYIVKNCELEIYFRFTREFNTSLDIENEDYSVKMDALKDVFCNDSFDAYEYFGFVYCLVMQNLLA